MGRFEVRERAYEEFGGATMFDVVDTEHDDQVVVRYANRPEAEAHREHLEADPLAPYPPEVAGDA